MTKCTVLAAALWLALSATPSPMSAQGPGPERAIRRDIPITNAIRRAMEAATRDSTGTPGAD